jgi:hypothetical protein
MSRAPEVSIRKDYEFKGTVETWTCAKEGQEFRCMLVRFVSKAEADAYATAREQLFEVFYNSDVTPRSAGVDEGVGIARFTSQCEDGKAAIAFFEDGRADDDTKRAAHAFVSQLDSSLGNYEQAST